jgi:hypothetical protein
VAACAWVAVFFVGFALYPRLVLTDPTPVKYRSGARVAFYSLSRSSRSVAPGRFLLREDGRSYRFYFTTDRPVDELGLEFGSDDMQAAVRLFDEPCSPESGPGSAVQARQATAMPARTAELYASP